MLAKPDPAPPDAGSSSSRDSAAMEETGARDALYPLETWRSRVSGQQDDMCAYICINLRILRLYDICVLIVYK